MNLRSTLAGFALFSFTRGISGYARENLQENAPHIVRTGSPLIFSHKGEGRTARRQEHEASGSLSGERSAIFGHSQSRRTACGRWKYINRARQRTPYCGTLGERLRRTVCGLEKNIRRARRSPLFLRYKHLRGNGVGVGKNRPRDRACFWKAKRPPNQPE